MTFVTEDNRLRTKIMELEEKIRLLEGDVIKAKQESVNANRKKTMFLANMSHEIRTPMNSIIGIYNLLNQTDLSDEQREFLDIINIASQNLLIIINDILDLSKIEAGELKLEKKPFSLHDEIKQVIQLLSLKAKGKGIELISMIDANTPLCVKGDAVRLKQILINLANNAIKFTNEGEVTIAVETIDPTGNDFDLKKTFIPEWIDPGQLKPSDRILKFSVIDTGIGISPEDQVTLFNEFAQLEHQLVRKYEGTGLGLSISRNLAILLKGRMGLISKPGEGSTFWFTLIMEEGDERLMKAEKEREVVAHLKTKPLDVLLVEDNLLNQKFAMTTLKREGHHVDLAENGKIALDKFGDHHYDLIIMDIAMPVMDGIEATRLIRAIEEEKRKTMEMQGSGTFRPVKIVAVTAHIMMADKDTCIQSGMDDFLAKPYRPHDLMKVIGALNIY